MNILYICDEYPPGKNGGIGSIVQNLSRELVLLGHNVFVVGLYTYEYGCADYELDYGVQVWRLRYGFKMPGISKMYGIQRRMPNVLKRLLFAKKDFERYILFLKKLIAENNIDVIEQPDWLSYAYFIGLKNPTLPIFGIPLILKFHGSHSYSCFELNKTPEKHFASIDLLNINRADSLVSVSEHNSRINLKIFGEIKPIKILYNAVAVSKELSSKNRETNLVFCAGTIKESKGTFSLLKAWNLVKQTIPEAQIILFGKGEVDKAIKFVLPQFRESVHFKGHQPRTELLSALEYVSVAVFPSYTEAFSMAPLESMSKACPTIYTKLSSGMEVIHDGQTGFLVHPDNIEEIAEKIIYLLQNPEVAKIMGEAGRMEVLNRFEIRKSTQDHLDFYNTTIRNYLNKK